MPSIAAARVRGFQGKSLDALDTIAACAKHYAAYGFAEAGRDYNTVDISDDTLYNVVLPPFKAAVEAGAAAERQALVGDVAVEHVPEPPVPGTVVLDEVLEPPPRTRIHGRTPAEGEYLVEQIGVEPRAQHRRVPKQGAVRGVEAVQALGNDPLDRLGQVLGGDAGLDGLHQPKYEQRVAARARDHRRDLGTGVRHAERRHGELRGVPVRERLDLDALHVRGVEGTIHAGPVGDHEHPREFSGPPRHLREQGTRSHVEVVAVLDLDQRRRRQERGQQVHDGPVGPLHAELARDRVRLRGARDLGIGDDGDQRKHRLQPGRHPLDHARQRAPRLRA